MPGRAEDDEEDEDACKCGACARACCWCACPGALCAIQSACTTGCCWSMTAERVGGSTKPVGIGSRSRIGRLRPRPARASKALRRPKRAAAAATEQRAQARAHRKGRRLITSRAAHRPRVRSELESPVSALPIPRPFSRASLSPSGSCSTVRLTFLRGTIGRVHWLLHTLLLPMPLQNQYLVRSARRNICLAPRSHRISMGAMPKRTMPDFVLPPFLNLRYDSLQGPPSGPSRSLLFFSFSVPFFQFPALLSSCRCRPWTARAGLLPRRRPPSTRVHHTVFVSAESCRKEARSMGRRPGLTSFPLLCASHGRLSLSGSQSFPNNPRSKCVPLQATHHHR
jgi:hypothetical protein